MVTKTLTNPKGITSRSVINVPDQWSADWFRGFIRTQFSNADVRNAVPGTGIDIDGTSVTTATISVSDEVKSLFHEPYVLAAAPADTVLDEYRVLGAETNVLAVTDGGNGGPLTISVAVNGINDTKLRKSSGASVIGNALATLGNVGDITATNDNTVLLRSSGLLGFASLPLPALAVQATNTVVGNVSGAAAAPIALSKVQLTALINLFSTTLPGAVPQSGGGTINFLRADGTWQPVTSANPSAKVGPTAVNGTATTFMLSDAAPAINLTAAYTWTGQHTFDAASGLPLNIITPTAGIYPLQFTDGTHIGGFFTSGTAGVEVQLGSISNHGLAFFTNNGAPALQISSVGDTKINGKSGFNGTAPIAKPTVTGSKGANAALASLLTALASYGLLVDSST